MGLSTQEYWASIRDQQQRMVADVAKQSEQPLGNSVFLEREGLLRGLGPERSDGPHLLADRRRESSAFGHSGLQESPARKEIRLPKGDQP
jgi:hypothetical protein